MTPWRPTLYGCRPWKMASSVNTQATRPGASASIPAFHWSRTPRRTSVPGTLTAVHMQDLTGDERRVLQIKNRVDDIVDLAETTDRMQFRQRVVRRRIMHRGADHAERHRVRADSTVRVLDRQRLGHSVQPAFRQ